MNATLDQPDPAADAVEAPFGANDVRLSPRAWLLAAGILLLLLGLIPAAWRRIEPFEPGADYRLPYRLGNDYWMFDRYAGSIGSEKKTVILGDSVVWGHYVDTGGTLSHYLNQKTGLNRFVNLGVDGIHPVALAGLVRYYGRKIAGRDVILHCNLLWMADQRRDLAIEKEFAFNHPRLVPQFFPRIPCYRESFSKKIGIAVQRELPFCGWSKHLRIAYFDNLDIPRWTMDRPLENPLLSVTLELPSPDEPPSPKPIAEAWTDRGIAKSNFRWVVLATSLQWDGFRRTVATLQHRGNRLFVLVGPLNEPMLTDASRQTYRHRKDEVAAWLTQKGIPHYVPAALPSRLYADASHPLAEGYALLAQRLLEDDSFVNFPSTGKSRPPH